MKFLSGGSIFWNIRKAFFWENANFGGVFVSWNVRNFVGWIFLFWSFKSYFLKYRKFFVRVLVSWNLGKFSFLKYKEFLNMRARKFHFPKMCELFFLLFEPRLIKCTTYIKSYIILLLPTLTLLLQGILFCT